MNSNKYSPQIRYVASAGSLPNRNGANWTSPLTLTGFLEPGAHLIRYLVDPGSRNHGSELPYDGGDLNAYKKFIAEEAKISRRFAEKKRKSFYLTNYI